MINIIGVMVLLFIIATQGEITAPSNMTQCPACSVSIAVAFAVTFIITAPLTIGLTVLVQCIIWKYWRTKD